MQTTRYAEILDTLAKLDSWLERMGIEPKKDRIHQAIEIVRKAEEGFETARCSGQPAKIGNIEDFYFGITEALEFCDIFRAFESEKPEVIGPRLQRALSGPLRPIEETANNADGRNVMFELALAAEWRLRGGDVILGEPDLILRLDDVPFLVACKRPRYEHSIRANVRRAAEQLQQALTREEFHGGFGIITISTSRILNPGDKIFQIATEEARHRLGDVLERLLHENEIHWKRSEFDPRVSAILFCVATPAAIEDRDTLARMSYSAIKAIGREGPAFNLLREKLSPLFNQ